jgi:hypothetical protein
MTTAETISPEFADGTSVLERYAEHSYANLETYKYFNQRGEAAANAKRAFVDAALAGETPAAPDFNYDGIDVDDVMAARDGLLILAQQASETDLRDDTNRLVRENITNRLHESGILLLTKMQSEIGPEDPRYETVSFQLGMNLREVYGVPEIGHWRGILGYRMSKLAAVEQKMDVPTAVRNAWDVVREQLPDDLPIEKPYQPRPETVAWYKRQLQARIEPARRAVANAIKRGDVKLTADNELIGEEIAKATNIALATRGANGWKAETTDETNIDTTQSHKTIYIPTARKMSELQFDAVIQGHEIDEHVIRRVNGDASGEPVLGGTGCNGYLAWEEGNGKVNEGLLTGKTSTELTANRFFLSCGLALGLDGQPRNFGQTFDVVWRMNYVDAYLKGKVTTENSEEMQRKIMENAADHLYRLFRGTDGQVPGVVFTKDAMTYYPGATQVWRKWDHDMETLSEEERIREHLLERSAKIDPLRVDHRRVAQANFDPSRIT